MEAKDVTPKKYKPLQLIIEDPDGKKIGIDLSHFEKGEYGHEFGKDNQERLSLTLWTGCESYQSFEPIRLEPEDDPSRTN